MKKYTFPEPGCYRCPYYQRVGETRYCTGFKRRKPRRFRSSDPKIKAPRWCPRRITPPICRIYGFADERSEYMELVLQRDFTRTNPSPYHYKVRMEIPLGMTAKRFYDETQMDFPKNILPPDTEIRTGEIIEIDDGLQPYYFYVSSFASVTPLPFFQMQNQNK